MKIIVFTTIFVIFLTTTSLVDAGFRCSIGEWSCKLSCKAQLKKTGLCDSEGECRYVLYQSARDKKVKNFSTIY